MGYGTKEIVEGKSFYQTKHINVHTASKADWLGNMKLADLLRKMGLKHGPYKLELRDDNGEFIVSNGLVGTEKGIFAEFGLTLANMESE